MTTRVGGAVATGEHDDGCWHGRMGFATKLEKRIEIGYTCGVDQFVCSQQLTGRTLQFRRNHDDHLIAALEIVATNYPRPHQKNVRQSLIQGLASK
jgi:hypothetical protein